MLILDEAHHAAPASGSRYAIDSQFTKAVRELASRFEHRLLLSATPAQRALQPSVSRDSRTRSASHAVCRFARATSTQSWSAA